MKQVVITMDDKNLELYMPPHPTSYEVATNHTATINRADYMVTNNHAAAITSNLTNSSVTADHANNQHFCWNCPCIRTMTMLLPIQLYPKYNVAVDYSVTNIRNGTNVS